jgi:probable HAF family extracellular repeat protein
MSDLGTFGGSVSIAHSINGAGQIVGTSGLSGNAVNHAFLYSGEPWPI